MVFASLMPVIVGWCLVAICVVTFAWNVTRADGVKTVLIPVVVCALSFLAVVVVTGIAIGDVAGRILVLAVAVLVVGVAVGWLLAVRPGATATALGACLLCAGLLFQLVAPTGEGGAGDAFALGAVAVEAAVVWGLFTAGIGVGAFGRRRQPLDTPPG
jgi:hypothetical protein